MNTNEVINCVREHLDKWYASNNHNETASQLVNEYEEEIRADEREKVIDLIDRHLWNYSQEVWEDFKPILCKLKEQK